VIAREDVSGDRRLVAYVTPTGAKAPDTDELRTYLKARLPEYIGAERDRDAGSLPLTPVEK